mmetsp:Transcript_15288/g.42623  ORF Transcript_15288/g.42623 Transcript_15288/m.42623 type:complete len:257 (+) Transcript_15288:128-898(+)
MCEGRARSENQRQDVSVYEFGHVDAQRCAHRLNPSRAEGSYLLLQSSSTSTWPNSSSSEPAVSSSIDADLSPHSEPVSFLANSSAIASSSASPSVDATCTGLASSESCRGAPRMPIFRLMLRTDKSAFFSPGGNTVRTGPPVGLPSSRTGRRLSLIRQPHTSPSWSTPALRIASTASSTACSSSVGLRSSTSLALVVTLADFFFAIFSAALLSRAAALASFLFARSASLFSFSAAISELYRSMSAAARSSYGARSS